MSQLIYLILIAPVLLGIVTIVDKLLPENILGDEIEVEEEIKVKNTWL